MSASVFRFDGYEVNVRTRELWKGGARVRLQDQPFQILAMMLERAGDVVTRDEIRARLWPDGTTVDFEHSVNAAIKRLRAALGDMAEEPRYVETLPRRGYRFLAPVEQGAVIALSNRNLPRDKPRLVVLPFANLSDIPAQDYFSDGLTEELIAQLGHLFGARIGVIARTSSMLLKGGRQTASEIGRGFGARYLIEGSVRREGDWVRVTAQLIETDGETHLWAESYNRRLADVLAVQSEVASSVARSLMIELLPGASPAGPTGTRNPDAYQAYLKGRFHWNKPGDVGLRAALVYFDEAIALDPEFSAAHSGRARCFISLAEYYRDTPRQALSAARGAAERALQLDPDDAEAHIALGEVRRALDWDSAGAEQEYRKAFAANPSFDAVHRCFAMFLAARGQLVEAAAISDRASDLDPFCFATATSAAMVRYFAREYDEVIRRCRHIVDMDPDYLPARRLIAAALEQSGRADEAVAELEPLQDDRQDAVSLACLGRALALSGNRRRALAMRDRLARLEDVMFVPAHARALLDAALGDADAAIAELEAACEQRDPWLDTIGLDPRFEALHDDPRFRAILSRLRIEATAA